MSNEMTPEDMQDIANEFAAEQKPLSIGDICKVSSGGGRDNGKTVIVLKPLVQTKNGPRAITVEEGKENAENPFKVWVDPVGLTPLGRSNVQAAKRLNDADFQAWKARNPR